jgi:hypothetical protein
MADDMTAMMLGRIIALEQLLVPQIIDDAARPVRNVEVDPVVLITRIHAARQVLLSSLQNLDRPVEEFADRVWHEMAGALENLFANAVKRAEGFRVV